MPNFPSIPSAETDAWTGAQGEMAGRPMLLRFRPTLATVLGHRQYPRRLIISWDFGDDGASGMPDQDQARAMKEFENSLVAALDPQRLAILAFVVTTAGVREWNYYVGAIDAVGARINEALTEQPGLPIALSVVDDADWTELERVFESVRE